MSLTRKERDELRDLRKNSRRTPAQTARMNALADATRVVSIPVKKQMVPAE